jgi:hypothetical protein
MATDPANTNPYVNDRRIRIREVLSLRDQELAELYWTAIEVLEPPTPVRRRNLHDDREQTHREDGLSGRHTKEKQKPALISHR